VIGQTVCTAADDDSLPVIGQTVCTGAEDSFPVIGQIGADDWLPVIGQSVCTGADELISAIVTGQSASLYEDPDCCFWKLGHYQEVLMLLYENPGCLVSLSGHLANVTLLEVQTMRNHYRAHCCREWVLA
jgi:hypothetical protein